MSVGGLTSPSPHKEAGILIGFPSDLREVDTDGWQRLCCKGKMICIRVPK